MWSLKEGQPVLLDLESGVILYTKQFSKQPTDITRSGPFTKTEIQFAFPKHKPKEIKRVLEGKTNEDEREQLEKFQKRSLFLAKGNFIPALGLKKFDGHMFVVGATGSGKSFMIQQMLLNDFKKRKIFLITDLRDHDPSFSKIFKTGRMVVVRRETFDDSEITSDDMKRRIKILHRKGKGCFIVFDDVSPRDKDVLSFRDDVLEKGRHKGVTAIIVNHQMRAHNVTKGPLTDSEYVISFPSSNRAAVTSFLKDFMDMNTGQRRKLIDIAQEDGRQMLIHLWNPNFVATAKTAVMI